jgi:Tfp pilus assembly protein FimT
LKKSRPGLSYIELLLVMATITLLTLLALPSLAALAERWELDAAAWRLVSDMRLARQTAITTGKAVRIEFRTTANDYRVFYPDRTERVRLPDNITYAGNNFPLVQGVRRVSFSALGAPSQGGTVTLQNKRGAKLYVIMTPATARIRVSKTPPAHWDQ